MSSASCGRCSLNSRRNCSKRRCCARRLAAIGDMVSCCRVRCMRSWRPFCSGCAGWIRSGSMPSFIHHTAKRDNPANRAGSEGRAVIGADRLRQAVLAERSLEDGLGALGVGLLHGLTAQQVAAAGIGESQRIDARAILGAAPAFEVAAPHPIGRVGRGEGRSIRIGTAPLLARDYQSFAAQQFAHRAHRRPRPIRLLTFQHRLQLSRPPAHVLVPQLHDLLLDLCRCPVGMTTRRTAALLHALPAGLLVASQRIVSGLARDPVPGTEFGHRPLL